MPWQRSHRESKEKLGVGDTCQTVARFGQACPNGATITNGSMKASMLYALSEAIEHGEKKQTTDATEHMMHAIMKLSQSVGLQIPEGVATGKTSTN